MNDNIIKYVVPGGAGNKDGSSWENAYANVQTAIDDVATLGGGEVWIKTGIYNVNGLKMKNNVAIYGGFAGTETAKSQRIAGQNITYFDGSDNISHAIYNNYLSSGEALTNSAKLDNITIQNYNGLYGWGSGLYNSYASPIITNCTFINNSSLSGGGAVHSCRNSSPKMINCTFTNNIALSSGGAVFISEDSSNELLSCIFENNYTNGTGGGISVSGKNTSNLTAIDCNFIGNSALSAGGAVSTKYLTSATILSGCKFTNNYTPTSAVGGAVYNLSSLNIKIIDCIFNNNRAPQFGGGIYNYNSQYEIINCEFENNYASTMGCGIYNLSSHDSIILSCIFSSQGGNTGAAGINNYVSENLSVIGCNFTDCHSRYGAATVNTSSNDILIESCTFFTNYVNSVDAEGGVIQNNYSTVNFINNSCINNKSHYNEIDACSSNGGVMWNNYSNINISSCSFSSNSAYYRGGVLYNKNSNITAIDCEFNNNKTHSTSALSGENGGAIYNLNSNLYLENCTLHNNKAYEGASIYNYNTQYSIINCEFKDNYATDTGSLYNSVSHNSIISNCKFNDDKLTVVYNLSSNDLSVINCDFKHNQGKGGAAIHNRSLTGLSIESCMFSGNYAYNYYATGGVMRNIDSNLNFINNSCIGNISYLGTAASSANAGVMYNENSIINISSCSFSSNSAYYRGGVLYNKNSNITAIDCEFDSNKSGYSAGGAIYNILSSHFHLENCTFINNSANSFYGGAIFNTDDAGLYLVNCTLYHNYAAIGGALYNLNSSNGVVLVNCTFNENHAINPSSYSGGIANGSSNLSVINCILWNDFSEGSNAEIYSYGNYTPNISNCIIEGGYSTGTNIITSNPKLLPLGNYGGLVKTIPVSAGSPAINAGKSNDTVTTDARGLYRYVEAPTIGACEYTLVDIKRDGFPLNTEENFYKFRVNHEFTLHPEPLPFVNPPITLYQWYKNGEIIDNETLTSCSLSQSERFANYTLNISDGNISATSNPLQIETLLKTDRYYVSTSGKSISVNDGLSWQNSLSSVQDGIDNAASVYDGCDLWVAGGLYKPSSSLKMKNGVRAYGGFAGTETEKDQRIPGQNKTYLDGNNERRVFNNDYVGSSLPTNRALIDNFVIQNGRAYTGGGMYNHTIDCGITDCTFINNSALRGGAIATTRGMNNYSILDCTFINNTANNEGGALLLDNLKNKNTPVEVANCTFYGNVATANATTTGGTGGLYINYPGSTPINVLNCTFYGNNSEKVANSLAVNTDGSNINIKNCIMWNDSYNRPEIYKTPNATPKYNTCVIYYGTYAIGTNIITADPRLCTLGDYGGNVPTIPVLPDGSAIKAALPLEEVSTDARGIVRSSTPTIGSFEYNMPYYELSAINGKILFNTTPINISNKSTVVSFEYNIPYSEDNDNEQFCFFVSTEDLSTLSSDNFTAIPLNNNYSGVYDPYLSSISYPTIYDIALTEANYFAISGDNKHGNGISIEDKELKKPSVVIRGYNNVTDITHYMYDYKLLDYNPLNLESDEFNQMRIRFSEGGTKINVDLKTHSSDLTSIKISDKQFTNILECKSPYDHIVTLSGSPVIFGIAYNANSERPVKIRNISITQ